jgi:heat-inducible transcriptional repressor
MSKYEIPQAEKNAIADELYSNITELDQTIEHAAKILSDITNLTSFAMTPKKDQDVLKFINLLPVDEKTIVLMIVSESGKVSNMTLKLRQGYDEESLSVLSKNMTYAYKGKTISEALTLDIVDTVHNDVSAMNTLKNSVMPSFMKTLEDMLNVNLYMDGLLNIFSLPEYNDIEKARGFFEMVGKKQDITRKLINRGDGIMITIGDENQDEELHDCTVITATYHVDGKMVGKIGVIGPTRMKYDEVTSVVEYLTDNISKAFMLTEGEKDDS